MPRAVLVDDEIWVRRDLELLLGQYPQYTLAGSFADGREALEFLRGNPCDVVFTDLRMGRMGGRQLIAACAAEHIDVYMVIISAYSDFDAAREGIQYGVLDYLLKPVTRADFARLLERIDERMRSSPHKKTDEELKSAIGEAYPACRVLCFRAQEGEIRAGLAAAERFGEDYALSLLEKTEEGFAIALLGTQLGELPALSGLRAEIGVSTAQRDFSPFPQMLAEAMQSARCAFRYAASDLVSSLQSHIALCYAQPLTLDALAAKFFLSKTYMCSAFRGECGMTLVSFITKVRMRMAALMLLESRMSVQEIASSVGYADSAYFSRTFKKAHGLSPEAYRKESLQSHEESREASP